MIDKDLILSELEVIGIRIDKDGSCTYSYAGNEISEPIAVAQKSFEDRAHTHKYHTVELWDGLMKHLSVVPLSFYEGSEATQHMFVNSVRQLNRLARRIRPFQKALPLIYKLLRMDSKAFSEGYMARMVEYSICVEWVFNLVRSDIYAAYLLEMLGGKAVIASGAMGFVNLPIDARVQVLDEQSDDDLEQGGRLYPTYTRQFRRYDLQHNHDAYDIEDRVYRLMNEPYSLNRRDERQPNRSLSRTI